MKKASTIIRLQTIGGLQTLVMCRWCVECSRQLKQLFCVPLVRAHLQLAVPDYSSSGA